LSTNANLDIPYDSRHDAGIKPISRLRHSPVPTMPASRRLLASLALFISFSCLAPMAAADDDFEDPKLRVRLLYKKFRTDIAADKQLKRCGDEALRNYLEGHLGEFIDLNSLIRDIAFKQTSERLDDMPDDRQLKLEMELTKFVVNDNLAAFKQVCTAGKLQIISSEVDFSVSQVETNLYRHSKRPLPVDFVLVRGWDKWLLNNVYIGEISLVDKYREQLGPAIASGGYEGMLNRLINLNM